MTVYIKELLSQIESRYGDLPAHQLTERLLRLGVLDHTLCKVLAVRQEVEDLMATGMKKIDAMWTASEKFCCSYEYVRKCIYYYTDIGMGGGQTETSNEKQIEK